MKIYYDPENFVHNLAEAAIVGEGEFSAINDIMRPEDVMPTVGQIVDLYYTTMNTIPNQLKFTIHELIDYLDSIPLVN